MMLKKGILFLFASLLLVGCVNESKIEEALANKPEMIIKALEKKPEIFIEFLTNLQGKARELEKKKREADEKKQLSDAMKNPLQAEIRSDESFRGPKDAPITLIEYSDFECPFCSRGYNTVMDLLKDYKGKVRFVYKHLPLSFHQNAMLASQYYEAIRLQNEDKAFEFHDEIYKNQQKLKLGEAFLKKLAKKVGANSSKLAKDVKSAKVINRIKSDMKEAEKFGFSGTPGFLLNGVPVKGAYPKSHFVSIINKLKESGKLKL